MFGLRTKLSLGFGGLLLIILVIGVQAILRVGELGQSIDVILRENYRSVIASQDMKESLERVDSGVLFILLGYDEQGKKQIEDNMAKFDKAFRIEAGNITLPGEKNAFATLEENYQKYQDILKEVSDVSRPIDARSNQYFKQLLPLFISVKQSANEILQLNQNNMSDSNMTARKKAELASQRMYLLLLCGVVIAAVFIYFIGSWILRPIANLISSTEEIRKGNLDLVVASKSQDEIGQLSKRFDAMLASLRESRRNNRASLLRVQHAMEQAFNCLPDPLMLINLDGTIEMATNRAVTDFGIRRETTLRDLPYPHAAILCDESITDGRAIVGETNTIIQKFIDGKELFFLPKAFPILNEENKSEGAILVFQDITPTRQQDEMKQGLISTVSHQLKTPLTSIRMALYLLLDDKLGPLTGKQEELIIAARDDSDRLHAIVEDLLDIARIQSGRIQIELQNANVSSLVSDSVEPFRIQAQYHGVTFNISIPKDLPEVQADVTRVPHVFANLLSNAIKYTSPGGRIEVSAKAEGDKVWFFVSDTGSGISLEHQRQVFDQFFRVPGERKDSGAGLGLAIAREIVTAHGGDIGVESQPGKGSVFSFSLKMASEGAVTGTNL
jgi:signal transduction histidine kinase/HAMP domain-containing protein